MCPSTIVAHGTCVSWDVGCKDVRWFKSIFLEPIKLFRPSKKVAINLAIYVAEF